MFRERYDEDRDEIKNRMKKKKRKKVKSINIILLVEYRKEGKKSRVQRRGKL